MHEALAYTVERACEVGGIKKTHLYGAIAAGRIDARKSGGRTLILADSLRRYVESLPPAEIRIGRKAAETTNAAAA